MKIRRKSGPRRILDLDADWVSENRGYDTPCWIWQGDRDNNGYGRIVRDGKRLKAHRLVYETLVGPIPEGLHLKSECGQRPCVNPFGHRHPNRPGPRPTPRSVEPRERHAPPRVAKIRDLYAGGEHTQADLAGMFGTTQQYISAIVRRKHWPD